MKLSRLIILSGLLVGFVPTPSFAECVPACAPGVSCRVLQQGPPTVFGCATAVRGARGPTGSLTAKQGSGNVMGNGPVPNNSTARTSDPTVEPRAPAKSKSEVSIESVNARAAGPKNNPNARDAHKESIEVASIKSRRERAAKATDTPKQSP